MVTRLDLLSAPNPIQRNQKIAWALTKPPQISLETEKDYICRQILFFFIMEISLLSAPIRVPTH